MATNLHREPWNKGIIVGQKAPLKLREVWAIRMRLQLAHRARELALLTGCLLAGRTLRISRPGNTRGSFIAGSSSSESMLSPTELTPSGERKHR